MQGQSMASNDGAKTEIKSHQETYASFLSLFRYGAVLVAIVAIVVILIISR